jgi:hypothetical protein
VTSWYRKSASQTRGRKCFLCSYFYEHLSQPSYLIYPFILYTLRCFIHPLALSTLAILLIILGRYSTVAWSLYVVFWASLEPWLFPTTYLRISMLNDSIEQVRMAPRLSWISCAFVVIVTRLSHSTEPLSAHSRNSKRLPFSAIHLPSVTHPLILAAPDRPCLPSWRPYPAHTSARSLNAYQFCLCSWQHDQRHRRHPRPLTPHARLKSRYQ